MINLAFNDKKNCTANELLEAVKSLPDTQAAKVMSYVLNIPVDHARKIYTEEYKIKQETGRIIIEMDITQEELRRE